MDYSPEEASAAINRCGADASIFELEDSIHAAHLALAEEDSDEGSTTKKKESLTENRVGLKRPRIKESVRRKYLKKAALDVDEMPMKVPAIGFGLPFEKCTTDRNLPKLAHGPPYFYYENVVLAPKGVWETIKRFLYDIEPEFVDSKYFCAAMRTRAYIHNLPIKNRFPRLPIPKKTIQELFPATKKWWPEWDTRTQFNCLTTSTGNARMAYKIRKALDDCVDVPSKGIQDYVLAECRKWNLIWVGHNKVAPLEPDEIETVLGFPKNHTRGGGTSKTARHKALGNSFQVDTVAYHLSVLKNLFPGGINVLSLFSGIGGAEVALDSLGIHMKVVVSVEISEVNRNILRCWWEQTNQKGILIDIDDVRKLNGYTLKDFKQRFGLFDIVIGRSPCNNLIGSNRVSRKDLEGKDSSQFFDYVRILDLVKSIADNKF